MKKRMSYLFAVIVGLLMVFAIMPLSMDQAHANTYKITVGEVQYSLNTDGNIATVIGFTDELPSTVTIPSSVTYNSQQYTVTSIGDNAFHGCSSLTTITIPASVTSIEDSAFKSSGLTRVDFASGSSLKSIKNNAFNDCSSLETITIPARVTGIGDNAFGSSGLRSVAFASESSLFYIGLRAFHDCSSLETITIPASVESIGEFAFESSGLKSIAFESGSNLIFITSNTFEKCSSLETITIPASVESIGESAFKSSGLASVDFASEGCLQSIGSGVFENCSNLETITIPASVESIGPGAFNSSGLKSVAFASGIGLKSIGENVFSNCRSLETITIPASVESIEDSAFRSSGLESVAFASGIGLKSIGNRAFSDCSSLETITIPASVTSIGEFAFDSSSLTRVDYASESSLQSIGNYAFHYCSSLETITIPASVESIGEFAFSSSGLRSVAFASGIGLKSIGNNAFKSCNSLETITIPASVESIGEFAFDSSGLRSVAFASGIGLKSIGNYAFQNCSSLETITIPASVESIGEGAFSNCPLTSINFLGPKDEWEAIGGGGRPVITNAFDVIFKDKDEEDGTVLQYSRVKPGETPSYEGATPTKAADAQHEYVFVGWNPEITAVTGNATYIAKFAHTDPYTIIFKNADGTELQSSKVAYGETPEYTGETPTKKADAQYTYTFKGWEPEIAPVTEETTYTATYSNTVNEYTVKFVNEDGTVLQSGKVAYGETPAYTEDTPTKKADAQYTYSFKGWEPEIAPVSGEATYTATFSKTVNEYTVKFVNEDGTVLQSGKVAYGETPAYTEDTPTKKADAQYTYTFKGWDSEIVPVTKEATYTATYSKTVNEYTVKFVNEDGTVLQSGKVAYGGTPAYTEDTPTKKADAQYTYTFKGWEPEIAPVTKEATYTATFSKTVNEYTVKFVNEDGTVLQSGKVAYGEMPAYTEDTPTKKADEQYTYTFKGWDSEIVPVTKEATYTATYSKTVNEYTVKFVNEDGTVLQSGKVAYGETPVYTGETPTKAADAQYLYNFKDWTPEIATVTGDETYTATYSETARISLKGAKVTLSAATFTYNGKVRKPTIKTIGGKKLTAGTDYKANWSNTKSKNVGAYTVTVTGKGKYTGTAKKATYKINPKGTSLASISADNKAFTVKWKKQSAKMAKTRITGYQVRYSTKSSMKSAKTVTIKGYVSTSKRIAKLTAKKKYYVQIRTYKTVSSKNYYSTWSKKKAVQTK